MSFGGGSTVKSYNCVTQTIQCMADPFVFISKCIQIIYLYNDFYFFRFMGIMVMKIRDEHFSSQGRQENVNKFCSVLSEPSIKRGGVVRCACVTLQFSSSIYHYFSIAYRK